MHIPWLSRNIIIICIFQVLSGAPPLATDPSSEASKPLWSCQVGDLDVKFTRDGTLHWGDLRLPTGTLSESETGAADAAWTKTIDLGSWGRHYPDVAAAVAAKRLSLEGEGTDGGRRELRQALDRFFDYRLAKVSLGTYAAIEDPGLEASEASGTPLARAWKRRLESVQNRSTEQALAGSAEDAAWWFISHPGTLDLRRGSSKFVIGPGCYGLFREGFLFMGFLPPEGSGQGPRKYVIWDPKVRCDPEEVWTEILQLRRILIGEQGHSAPSRWPGYEKRFPEATRRFLSDSLWLTGPDQANHTEKRVSDPRTQVTGHKRSRPEREEGSDERPRKRQRRDETQEVTDSQASRTISEGQPEVCHWHLEGENADLMATGSSYGFQLGGAYYLKMAPHLWQMGSARRLPFRLDGDKAGLVDYVTPLKEDRVLLAKLRGATRELVASLRTDGHAPAGVPSVLQEFLDDTAGLDLECEPTLDSPQKLKRLENLKKDGMLDFSQDTLETKDPTPTGSGSGNAFDDDSMT